MPPVGEMALDAEMVCPMVTLGPVHFIDSLIQSQARNSMWIRSTANHFMTKNLQ